MGDQEKVRISDYHVLAVLDCLRIRALRSERNGRYYEFYEKLKVASILSDYDSGALTLPVRDFVAALSRVKTRNFESERQNGAVYGNPHR